MPYKNREDDRKNSQTPNTRYVQSKTNAKTRGVAWELSKEEYFELIAKPCYYCEDAFGMPVKTGVGLDRIDNNGGYSVGNVLPACKVCNAIRKDVLTVEETKVGVVAALGVVGIRITD